MSPGTSDGMVGGGVELPLVLAGPILRRLTAQRLTLWLVLSEPVRVRLELSCGEASPRTLALEPGSVGCRLLSAGARLHYLLIDLQLAEPLPSDRWIGYQIALQPLAGADAPWQDWSDWAPELCYPGKCSPGFVLPVRVAALLHGSCRKPHYRGGDGLVQADRLLARCVAAGVRRASRGLSTHCRPGRPRWFCLATRSMQMMSPVRCCARSTG
jgi:hypothetical protein